MNVDIIFDEDRFGLWVDTTVRGNVDFAIIIQEDEDGDVLVGSPPISRPIADILVR